jgi:hypothetical protein
MKNPSQRTRLPIATSSGKTADSPKAVLDENKPNLQESTHSQVPRRIAKPVVAQPLLETSSSHSLASMSHNPDRQWKVVSNKKGAKRMPMSSGDSIGGPAESILSSQGSAENQQESSHTFGAKLEPLQSQDPHTNTDSGLISGNLKDGDHSKDAKQIEKSDQDVNDQSLVSTGIG